jgi:hypothetical protein
MYNLYSILKTPKHNVLLVRQLHLVSPVMAWVRTSPAAPFFKHFTLI